MSKAGDELVKLSRRRARLASDVERIRGRQEAARQRLEEIKEECRGRNLDPDNLEEVISRLEEALAKGIEGLTRNLDQVEETLQKYL